MSSTEIKTTEKSATIKVGSRKSKLALIQTNSVIDALKQHFPDKTFEIVEMSTTGDKILDKPLPKIGEKSLFTKELEIALDEESVDFVVHSLKDLPTTLPPRMAIGAVCRREDPRDAVMLHPKLKDKTLETLLKGSIIGTSSLRRMAQIRQRYAHLVVRSIRGNLNTRLAKLEASNIDDEGQGDFHSFSALILAASGMERMGWEDKIGQILEPSEHLYAVGQGALAIECRMNDRATLALLSPLHDKVSALRVVAERSLLKTLGGGCSAPVAVHSEYDEEKETLSLQAGVWSLDGKKHIFRNKTVELKDLDDSAPPPAKLQRRMSTESQLYAGISEQNVSCAELDAAEKLGEDVALQLEKAGATPIMDEARAENELSPEAKILKELGDVPGASTCVAARLAIRDAGDKD